MVTISYGTEFFLFQSSILKVIRNLLLVFGLFLIARTDGRSRRIPNQWLAVMAGIRTFLLIPECLGCHEGYLMYGMTFFTGALLGGGMFFCCHLLTGGAVGAGDVKLLAVAGYYLGSQRIVALIFWSVTLAAVYCVSRLVFNKTQANKAIPFAPFVFAGVLLLWMVYGITGF